MEQTDIDFFGVVLGMDTEWEPVSESKDVFEGYDRETGEQISEASRGDLIFGVDLTSATAGLREWTGRQS